MSAITQNHSESIRFESPREGLEKNLVKLKEELTSRGYRKASVAAALPRARQLNRPDTLTH